MTASAPTRPVVKWYVYRDTEQWIPFFNWEPRVDADGQNVFAGGEVVGVGPKLWALWKAWRYAHKIAPSGATVFRGEDV